MCNWIGALSDVLYTDVKSCCADVPLLSQLLLWVVSCLLSNTRTCTSTFCVAVCLVLALLAGPKQQQQQQRCFRGATKSAHGSSSSNDQHGPLHRAIPKQAGSVRRGITGKGAVRAGPHMWCDYDLTHAIA